MESISAHPDAAWGGNKSWPMPSDTVPDVTYTVGRHGDHEPDEDLWTCTCPGYQAHSGSKMHWWCKHIRAIMEQQISCLRYGSMRRYA